MRRKNTEKSVKMKLAQMEVYFRTPSAVNMADYMFGENNFPRSTEEGKLRALENSMSAVYGNDDLIRDIIPQKGMEMFRFLIMKMIFLEQKDLQTMTIGELVAACDMAERRAVISRIKKEMKEYGISAEELK